MVGRMEVGFVGVILTISTGGEVFCNASTLSGLPSATGRKLCHTSHKPAQIIPVLTPNFCGRDHNLKVARQERKLDRNPR